MRKGISYTLKSHLSQSNSLLISRKHHTDNKAGDQNAHYSSYKTGIQAHAAAPSILSSIRLTTCPASSQLSRYVLPLRVLT